MEVPFGTLHTKTKTEQNIKSKQTVYNVFIELQPKKFCISLYLYIQNFISSSSSYRTKKRKNRKIRSKKCIYLQKSMYNFLYVLVSKMLCYAILSITIELDSQYSLPIQLSVIFADKQTDTHTHTQKKNIHISTKKQTHYQ